MFLTVELISQALGRQRLDGLELVDDIDAGAEVPVLKLLVLLLLGLLDRLLRFVVLVEVLDFNLGSSLSLLRPLLFGLEHSGLLILYLRLAEGFRTPQY